jgi:hypothetical protein
MRPRLREWLASAGAFALLLLALMAFDERLREEAWRRATLAPATNLQEAGGHLAHQASMTSNRMIDIATENTALWVFSITGLGLLALMLRK